MFLVAIKFPFTFHLLSLFVKYSSLLKRDELPGSNRPIASNLTARSGKILVPDRITRASPFIEAESSEITKSIYRDRVALVSRRCLFASDDHD